MSRSDGSGSATEARLPSALGDDAALRGFLARHGVLDEPVGARLVGDGHSNLTYLLTGTDTGTRVVLRRPPTTATPGAHDVLREARFMAALADTDVPVPHVFATAAAGELLDVPCFVMEYVAGPVVTTSTPAPLDTPAARRSIGFALADTLAALHAVDPRSVGLGDIGRPEGFNRRNLERMTRLVTLPDGSMPPEFAELYDWLRAHAPAESDTTIYHGDFRLGNVLLAPDAGPDGADGRVAAVLDWELATIGDPLIDVAYLLATFPVAGEVRTPTQDLGSAVDEPGWPTRAEIAERYAAASGRSLDGLAWYSVFALWKVATLYEFSTRAGRDPYYEDPSFVPSLLAASRAAAGGAP
jgi:aminoglycoside phosphotransferase (APT) family kinase protein